MKIGILTFHSALNYGAVLQAYASVHFLRSAGHDAFVVDYKNSAINQNYTAFRWDRARAKAEGIVYWIKYPITALQRIWRGLAFRRFQKNYIPLIPFSKAAEMDVLFIGSDQVWNKKLTNGADPVYFGSTFSTVRKIAWAASVGLSSLEKEDIDLITGNFSAISVREQALNNLIPGSVLLPDPTTMLSADDWKEIVHPVKGEYLLAYPMLYTEEVIENARKIAAEKHLELKVLSPVIKLGSGWIQKASPDEFVSLFYNASYVVTSSFHGAAFTLLFKKPHLFIHHEDPRYDTLLETDLTQAKARAKAFIDNNLKEG